MTLLTVGLSHRSAPVSVLERAALDSERRGKLLTDMVGAEPVVAAAVLATCNRIELYADVDRFHAGVAGLTSLLARHSGVSQDELTPYLYVHYEDRVVHHLFSVACGLDSMVVGEGQILGQIKAALALAQEEQTAGRTLNELFQQALRVGKRAHSETAIDRAGQSLVTFGLTQLAQLTGGSGVESWAQGRRALVIGAGSMSALAATTLARTGVAELVIANRTLERAEGLAESLPGRAVPMAGQGVPLRTRAVPINAISIAAELALADIVVSCTGATGLVLRAEAVQSALRERAARRARSAGKVTGSVTGGQGGAVRRRPPGTAGPVRPAAPTVDGGPRAVARAVGSGSAVPERVAETSRAASAAKPGGAPVLAMLDLAMPRDIDAAVHRLDGARLVDIESLAEASAAAPMAADVDAVRRIVADEVAVFSAAQRAARITPTVVALRAMASAVVTGEMARLHGRLPDLGDRERTEIARTVRRVVDKLLHAPTVRVKELAGEPGGADYATALRELFDLDPRTVAAVSNPEQERP